MTMVELTEAELDLVTGGSASGATTGDPSCNGFSVSISNHLSGEFGASGNSNASAGAGYFYQAGLIPGGLSVPEAIAKMRSTPC